MILDTSAWVELFIGSKKGASVKGILYKNDCYSSIVTFAEIVNWALREKKEPMRLIEIIEKSSKIIGLDKDIVTLAGKLNFERKKLNKKWGMMDSLILASSMIYGLRILTKDNDFRDVPEVIIL